MDDLKFKEAKDNGLVFDGSFELNSRNQNSPKKVIEKASKPAKIQKKSEDLPRKPPMEEPEQVEEIPVYKNFKESKKSVGDNEVTGSDILKLINGKKRRCSLQLSDSTISIVIAKYYVNDCSLSLLIPVNDESVVFYPNPGSEVKLEVDDKTYVVFYAGINFLVDELNLMVMSFTRTEND